MHAAPLAGLIFGRVEYSGTHYLWSPYQQRKLDGLRRAFLIFTVVTIP